MSSPRWLTHFGFDAPPFSKEIGDEQLWVPSSRQRVLDRLVAGAFVAEHERRARRVRAYGLIVP